jgi:hypothetical protein
MATKQPSSSVVLTPQQLLALTDDEYDNETETEKANAKAVLPTHETSNICQKHLANEYDNATKLPATGRN